MARGEIILLNGTPSSGKTTLARALRDASPRPVFFQSLDEFRLGVLERFWIGDDAVRSLFAPMRDAWMRMLREVALCGIPVVAEAVVLPEDRARYDEVFGDLDVLFVGVLCPLDVVREREASRTDRLNGPQEVTADAMESVHRHEYALTIDTSVEPTDRSVARILRSWGR